jgi:hypothetical protein
LTWANAVVGDRGVLLQARSAPTSQVDVLKDASGPFPLKNPALIFDAAGVHRRHRGLAGDAQPPLGGALVEAERQIHRGAAVPEPTPPALPAER